MEEGPHAPTLRPAADCSPCGPEPERCSGVDARLGDDDLPTMHWEDLGLRITELERQEEERRSRAESLALPERDSVFGSWTEWKHRSLHRKLWTDEEDFGPCRVSAITSRFNSPKNLQLCFINNSESEDEDDDGASGKEAGAEIHHSALHSLCEAEGRGSCSGGLKQEVRVALTDLRDKLWTEQKNKEQETHNNMNIRRRRLSVADLQTCSSLQLSALRASLNEDIQDLSSELVKHLVTRDHLRTKRDALLLDVQDLTSP